MEPSPIDAVVQRGQALPQGLCVLGLGLIGGSVLRAASDLLPVSGWSPSETTRAEAAASGAQIHPTLEQALAWAVDRDALVMLASPVTGFESMLRKITAKAPEVLLTDVGSVKASVARQVTAIAPRTRYVGGHPMAGTSASGFAAADPDLFRGAAWVTCLQQSSNPIAWDCVAALALALGSHVVPVTAADHDSAVARISHLPHLLALALAQVAASGTPLTRTLAASSFRDGSRVAGTRPELIQAMCEANRDALVDAFDESLGILGVARGTLASTGSLGKTVEAGHRGFLSMQQEPATTVVTLNNPTIDDLLTLGADGGYITGLRRTAQERIVTGIGPVN